jgi:hypothetical protein
MTARPHHWHDVDAEDGKDFEASSATIFGSQVIGQTQNVRATAQRSGMTQQPLDAWVIRDGERVRVRRRRRPVTTRSIGAVRPGPPVALFRF